MSETIPDDVMKLAKDAAVKIEAALCLGVMNIDVSAIAQAILADRAGREAELYRVKAERDEAVKAAEYKARGQGMAVAAGIVCSSFGEPTIAAEILGAAGLRTVGDMRKAEVDPYDVKLCRPALKELRPRAARSFLTRMEAKPC